jgi:DNA-binding SARP family transcriptional activator
VLSGRWAVPLAKPAARGSLPLVGLAPSVPLRVDVLPGEVHAGRLAADLKESGLPPRWIRLATYDLDRQAFDALAVAVQGGDGGGGGTATRPAAGGRWALVVESADSRQVERFLSRFAVAQPPGPAPCPVVLHFVDAAKQRRAVARADDTAHPATLLDIALDRLVGRRPALCESVLDAGRSLRSGELVGIIAQSRGLDDLTTRLAARLLRDLPPPITTLLGLAALLGYGHRRFGSLEPVLDCCGDLPWWTQLTGDWRAFDSAWRAGVLAVCRSDLRTEVSLVGRLVLELVEDGAVDAAIELCMDAGYFGIAGDLLAGVGPKLVSAGRPISVRRWLRRLPWAVRRGHRELRAQIQEAHRADTQGQMPVRPRPRLIPVRSCRKPASVGATSFGGQERVPKVTCGTAHPAGNTPLEAHLLGSVDVSVGEHRVEHWRGRKGTLLLAYLLMHRAGRSVPRDALAAALWPDAPPDVSRNRLHVTMHTLRADLQAASPVPVVVFEKGYTFNSELDIRLDIEEFERAAARGSRAEREYDPETAFAAYHDAIFEYHGDLLKDNPYDDWTLLPREHYRVRMLDVLGRAAQLAFDAGRYAESVESGQRLLALDFCREDVHRLLMRAHARLGQPHLAVRQFQLCSRQLRREMDMSPARETIELYGRIRARVGV